MMLPELLKKVLSSPEGEVLRKNELLFCEKTGVFCLYTGCMWCFIDVHNESGTLLCVVGQKDKCIQCFFADTLDF